MVAYAQNVKKKLSIYSWLKIVGCHAYYVYQDSTYQTTEGVVYLVFGEEADLCKVNNNSCHKSYNFTQLVSTNKILDVLQ